MKGNKFVGVIVMAAMLLALSGVRPAMAASPIGWHDWATEYTTAGWACDPDNWSAPLQIHFYLDNPAGSGTFLGWTTANLTREPAVASLCGGYSNHGFQFSLPSSVRDGRNHTIYAYAIDYNGGTNPLLSSSPKTIIQQPTKFIDSSSNGYTYAYAPSIIQMGDLYHMFYCSTGSGVGAWDFIRYATSANGLNWSAPQIVLSVSNSANERAACDPAVVYYNNYYYLFYSGNKTNVQTVMFVARSSAIGGPYYKYTNRGTWEINPSDPKIIIAPRNAVPEGQPFYGAGQQTVVAARGKLYSWYYDDTLAYPNHRARLMFTTATDPTKWATAVETNLATSSVDVKYDPVNNRFVMADIDSDHSPTAQLMRYVSSDGTRWSGSVLINASSFPDYTHNVGVSGNRAGHLLPYTLVGFGAPYDLSSRYRNECQTSNPSGAGYPPYCWGYWDMYGVGTGNFTP